MCSIRASARAFRAGMDSGTRFFMPQFHARRIGKRMASMENLVQRNGWRTRRGIPWMGFVRIQERGRVGKIFSRGCERFCGRDTSIRVKGGVRTRCPAAQREMLKTSIIQNLEDAVPRQQGNPAAGWPSRSVYKRVRPAFPSPCQAILRASPRDGSGGVRFFPPQSTAPWFRRTKWEKRSVAEKHGP